MTATIDELDALVRRLTDEGKLCEAGWTSFRRLCIPLSAREVQVTEMRKAFLAGMHHLFFAILMALEDGDEPTDVDIARMDQIAAELKAWWRDETEAQAPQARQ